MFARSISLQSLEELHVNIRNRDNLIRFFEVINCDDLTYLDIEGNKFDTIDDELITQICRFKSLSSLKTENVLFTMVRIGCFIIIFIWKRIELFGNRIERSNWH